MEIIFVNDEKFDENLKQLSVYDTNKKIAMICIFQANRYFRYNNNLMNRQNKINRTKKARLVRVQFVNQNNNMMRLNYNFE